MATIGRLHLHLASVRTLTTQIVVDFYAATIALVITGVDTICMIDVISCGFITFIKSFGYSHPTEYNISFKRLSRRVVACVSRTNVTVGANDTIVGQHSDNP
jgi:hypothetical protein